MALVTTPAIVLQTYRYSETSKIVRLATRELGVQSAIAKGVMRPKSKFGAGLEVLGEGTAQLYYRETRELQTLGEFELEILRHELARDVARFAGATALAEVMLKTAPPAALPAAYAALVEGLDALVAAPGPDVDAAAIRALWRLLGVLGFEAALTACVRDGTPLDPQPTAPVPFSASEGGAFCPSCAPAQAPTRLPPQAYRDLVTMGTGDGPLPALDASHAAAHRRLVVRFAQYHLGAPGNLPALEFWERRPWSATS
jgi:DNA repair protein RecO (recombination protein O)